MFVLHGYALIDNAAMPIIGDAETVNNTYIDQLVMDAQAAVDKGGGNGRGRSRSNGSIWA